MIKMKKIIFSLILLGSLFLNAQNLSGIDPAYYDYDPRTTALGGASAALVSISPAALLHNPAALDLKANYQIFFSNSTYLDLISYNYAGISRNYKLGSTLSFAFDFTGDEVMTEYEIILSWSGKPSSFFITGTPIDRCLLGFNLRLLGSSFGNNESGSWFDENGLNHQVKGNSYGFALDLGWQYHHNDRHSLGFYNRNLINTIFWVSENEVNTALGKYYEARPVSLVAGYAYSQKKAILCLDYDISLYKDRKSFLKSGVEIRLLQDILLLRSGISTQLFSLKTMHYNFGCGINFKAGDKNCSLDLAYRIFTNWQGSNNLLAGLRIPF
jgi:hypothetical protein